MRLAHTSSLATQDCMHAQDRPILALVLRGDSPHQLDPLPPPHTEKQRFKDPASVYTWPISGSHV